MNRGMSELKNIEIKLLSRLERRTEEQISNIMDEVYNECCMIDKIDYSKGYGFGSEGIKEYIISLLLLDLIEEDDEIYFIGSIRLLIKGVWGSLDYAKIMRYVSREKLGISSETWHHALNLVEERFPSLLESELVMKQTKEPIYTDVGIIEKISILENIPEDDSFEDRIDRIVQNMDNMDYLDDKKKNKSIENKSTDNEEIAEYDDEQISLVNYHMNNEKKDKKGKIILIISILIALLLLFIWISGSKSKSSQSDETSTSTTEENTSTNEGNPSNNMIISLDENDKNTKEEESVDPSLKSYENVNYKTAIKYYCLYSQAFVYEKGAIEVSEKIKSQNIYCKVVEEDNCYKVRIGSDYKLKEVNKIQEELSKVGIDTYVLAYDKEVESQIEVLRQLSKSGNSQELKDKYIKLRNELINKSTYGRYVDQVDYIYRNIK